jgi:hypothetical protein
MYEFFDLLEGVVEHLGLQAAKTVYKQMPSTHGLQPAPVSPLDKCSSSKEEKAAPQGAAIDDYVVKLLPKGHKVVCHAYFFGYVFAISNTIQCMQHHNMSVSTFIFPEKEDIAVYTSHDIF